MDVNVADRVFCSTDVVINHVLPCLGARDLCVFVHMLAPLRCTWPTKNWQKYFWVTRKDTACADGARFNQWFGGHTGLCQCDRADNACTRFACQQRLLRLRCDTTWQQNAAYHDFGPIAWAGPTTGTGPRRDTLVVYKQGMVGVLGWATHHGWLLHPVHMPLGRLLYSTTGAQRWRRGITQCVPFDQHIGVLCGRNMVVLRRTTAPYLCGTWHIGSALMLPRRVAICATSRLVFAACTTGVLFVQKYANTQAALTGADFVTLDRGFEALGNRSVAMVALLRPGVVLVRDYATTKALRAVQVCCTGEHSPHTVTVVAHHSMPQDCVVQELVTLRYQKGVGVVCHKTDDIGVMALWSVSALRNDDGSMRLVAKCLQPWHRCPNGVLVDIANYDSQPWLVGGSGNMWRTGAEHVIMVQSNRGATTARRVCWNG